MSYARSNVLSGETVRLKVVLTDGAGNAITPDSAPVVYIYDDLIDSEVKAAEIEAETFDSAIAGPLSATEVMDGFYYVDYVVPDGSDTGTWSDIWVAVVNGTTNIKELYFFVQEEIDISDQAPSTNTMLILKLSDDITDTDGVALEDTTLYYTTTYDPFYSSPDQIRAHAGPWVNYLRDEAIALLIHWSSKEADFLKRCTVYNQTNYKFARTMYVTYDTILKIFNQPGGGMEAGFSSGRKKQLGDLSISDGTPNTEIDPKLYTYILEQRDGYLRVVNSGGNIVLGESYDIVTGVKGDLHPDVYRNGRMWFDPNDKTYPRYGSNTKEKGNGRLYRHFWKDR